MPKFITSRLQGTKVLSYIIFAKGDKREFQDNVISKK